MQSEERLRRIEQATNLPLLGLALAMIPLLLAPIFFELSAENDRALLMADWGIWACFTVDFALKVAVAPRRLRYIRSHWLEGAMVVLPFLRPLRVLRVLRGARVAAAVGLNSQVLRDLARSRGTQFVVAAVLVILVAGAGLALGFERHAQGGNITSFGDALWWAATTMTTVGYGDLYPVTAAGRGVAITLMLLGIAALSALTATIAAFLVRESEGKGPTLQDVMAELEALRGDVARLRDRETD